MLKVTVKKQYYKKGHVNITRLFKSKSELAYYLDDAEEFFHIHLIIIEDSDTNKVITKICSSEDWEYYAKQDAIEMFRMSKKAFDNYSNSGYIIENNSKSCKIFCGNTDKSNFVCEVATITELNEFFETE